MKKFMSTFICILLILCMIGCGGTQDNMIGVQDIDNTDESVNITEEIVISDISNSHDEESENDNKQENMTMRLFINDTEVPVIWEDALAVKELQEEASKGDIIVAMSMYSDNEQVGSLGKKYSSNNEQTTTQNGDIVLYNSSNIVVFYGSNTWSYTRLGKMDLSENEVVELLSNGDVILTLRNN